MITNLGWVAVYSPSIRPFKPVGHIIKQYYEVDGIEFETPISSLGAWFNYKLDRNMPVLFLVGRNGVNLLNGDICLEGSWKPAMPGMLPKKLIYYRVMRATLNGGIGRQCWHYIGYECDDHALKIRIPDDTGTPSVELDQIAANSAKPQGVRIG